MVKKSPELFLGIDFGTSGCRGAVIDAQGELVTLCKIDLQEPQIDGQHVRQNPVTWRKSLIELLQLISRQVAINNIVALSIDGTSGTVCLSDDDGTAVSSALMYNDASSVEAAALIKKLAPSTSGAHGPSSGLAKLSKLLCEHQTNTPIYATSQADWLAAQITGKAGICDANNALKMGYDVINDRWPDWVCEVVDCEKLQLPEIVAPGVVIGQVSNTFAPESGLTPSTQVISGTTDSIAALIATGVKAPGEAVTSLGSTLVVKLISDKPVFDPASGIYSHKLGDTWLVGGASNAGCAVFKQYFSQSQIDEMTTQLKPDKTTGLDYYPLNGTGERFPIMDNELEPRLTPRPEDDVMFFQAMLEGLSRIELLAYQKLQQLGAPFPKRILTCGGGSQNPAWIKIRANVLKTRVEPAHQVEAAYGSALLAKQGFQNRI